MLTRQDLERIAVDGYFGSVARGDGDAVAALFADNAAMRIVSAGICYQGKAAIIAHFDDFLGEYDAIRFSDFAVTADEPAQRVAVEFTIALHNAGSVIIMHNCDFFSFDEHGLVRDVSIYMSDLPERGF
mgnify:CR=1 FL=1